MPFRNVDHIIALGRVSDASARYVVSTNSAAVVGCSLPTFKFLAHVRACVRSNEEPKWTSNADKCTESSASPSTTVLEFCKDSLGGYVVAQSPHDDQEGEEADL